MSDKKKEQLGINPSTASARLVKDILWSLIVETGKDKCCKCGSSMNRETFSIEHIIPWLDSDDPVGLFFSLENISFSHLSCNFSDARRERRVSEHGTLARYGSGCRCDLCKKAKSIDYASYYSKEKRSERYRKAKG